MRRRIREAIVGVTAAIVLLLGIPLAVAVHRVILDAEVVKVQASATRTLAEISLPLNEKELAAIRREPDAPPPFTIYDGQGRRTFGPGPRQGGALVRRALMGNLTTSTEGAIEVVTPISDRSPEERVIGAVRLSESLDVTDRRSRVAWLVMAGSAALAIGLAWLIGNRLARRLSQPIVDLVEGAGRIGDHGAQVGTAPSGIEEIDELSAALSKSTERVTEALARERRFSADVSHQLRTPITALRLQLEAGRNGSHPLDLTSLTADLDRLEGTVGHLLAVARDAMPVVASVRVDELAAAATARWQHQVQAAGRKMQASIEACPPARGSAASVGQVLDVLVDNAIRHGDGTIQVAVRPLAGGVAVDVTDEGSGIALADAARIFDRGHGDDHGIGLALARSIAEAEGGRLLLTHVCPTTFSLLLTNHDLALEVDRQ